MDTLNIRCRTTVNSIKLETGLRPNSAGIPYTLLLRTEAIGFPTFGLPLYIKDPKRDPNFDNHPCVQRLTVVRTKNPEPPDSTLKAS